MAGRLGHGDQIGLVTQQVVQPRGEIEAFLQRHDQNLFPFLTDNAAAVRHADNQSFGPGRFRFGQRHVGQAQIGLAALHPVLAQGVFGTPVLDANCHFGRQLVGRIAQKQQVRCLDHCGLSFNSDAG